MAATQEWWRCRRDGDQAKARWKGAWTRIGERETEILLERKQRVEEKSS